MEPDSMVGLLTCICDDSDPEDPTLRTRARRTINHCCYMLSRAVSTLLAHHHRTGADLERWFGQWKPPDPKWWLSEEAA